MESEKENLGRKIGSKEEELKDKLKEIEDLKVTIQKKEREFAKYQQDLEKFKDGKAQQLKQIQERVEQAKVDKKKFYDFDRFDFNYLDSTAKLFGKKD
mmetsp:Transcript_30/g.24  ORF Transcript_30/g.24 Transcript_30/m.24 type:complete len:98 (-) Transcript_30:27-320(-)